MQHMAHSPKSNGPSTRVPHRTSTWNNLFRRVSLLCKSDNSRNWSHEGQITGNHVEYEDNLDECSEKKLYKYNNQIAVAIIYGEK